MRRGIMIASFRFEEADDDDDNDVDGMIHPTFLFFSFAFADSFIRLSLTFEYARPLGAFFPHSWLMNLDTTACRSVSVHELTL